MSEIEIDYVDHMGSDLTVVNAARVSFNKHTTTLEKKDEKLIAFLAMHDHWTPFGHCIVTIRETVPIFVARQRFKHTVGFCYNEVSRRYVSGDPDFFTPEDWRASAENVKQGSSDSETITWFYGTGSSDFDETIDTHVEDVKRDALNLYKSLLDLGVCAEQARMVLPQSLMTSYYVTGSLSAWSRAYKLRIAKTAQKEIQNVAARWAEIIEPLFPISWKNLTKIDRK